MVGITILVLALAIAVGICWLILRSVRAGAVRVDIEDRAPGPNSEGPADPR
ncbi:hypothetical protein NSK11_contig00249-0001 [Nocardia seriolae]|uniref:Uncharacterized protein n=1 Tax=Nocardia seriolae TaxID=37332 RepID=A0ABC9Z7C3_9NOCA|nr:hypothetical protein NS07_v2contig00245-0001 [Nocardia seriolae]GAP33348.1 hypothetical protein NSK11_contig00249-0001 [Nocardia seriolae]GEM28876.1 hypothetical protein NS2_71150 [Nocardia seriolae NBRC 15557]